MKKYDLAAVVFAFCIFLTACGGKGNEESGWSAWQGIAPGDDISAVIERTEYYDFTVEEEELFVWDYGRRTPRNRQYLRQRLQEAKSIFPLAYSFGKGSRCSSGQRYTQRVRIFIYTKVTEAARFC